MCLCVCFPLRERNDSGKKRESTGRENGMRKDSVSLESLHQSDSWAALDADEEMVFDEELEAMIKQEQEKKQKQKKTAQRAPEAEKHDTALDISPEAPQKNIAADEKRADTQITILPKQHPQPQSQQQKVEKTQHGRSQENPWKLNSSADSTPLSLEMAQKEEVKMKKHEERQRVEPRRVEEIIAPHYSRGRDPRPSRGPEDRHTPPTESKQSGPMIQPRTILKRESQAPPQPRQRIVLAPVMQSVPSAPARQHILEAVTPNLPSSIQQQPRRTLISQRPELDIEAVETQSERMERFAEQARQKRLEEEERLENERKERAKAKLLALEKKLEEKRRASQPQNEDKKEEKEAATNEAREETMTQRVDKRRRDSRRQRQDRSRSKRQPTPDAVPTDQPAKDHTQPENKPRHGRGRNRGRNASERNTTVEQAMASSHHRDQPSRSETDMKTAENLAPHSGMSPKSRDAAADQTEKEKAIVGPQSISTDDKDKETENEITTRDQSDDGEWVEMKSKRQKWAQKRQLKREEHQNKRDRQQKGQKATRQDDFWSTKKERVSKTDRVTTSHGSIDAASDIQFGTRKTESPAKHDSSNTKDTSSAETSTENINAQRHGKTQKLPSERTEQTHSNSHSQSRGRRSRSKQRNRSSRDKKAAAGSAPKTRGKKIRYVEESS